MDKLAKQNPHERDDHITFDEGPHIYTIDGEIDFMSVTTWNHSHFAEGGQRDFLSYYLDLSSTDL